MNCRTNCGACCTAPSISTPLPGLGTGKPAGVPCVHLKPDYSCAVWEQRPAVCRDFEPHPDYCGQSRDEAMEILTRLEHATAPKP